MYHIFLNMVWSIWYGSFNMANVHNYFTLIFINLLCLKNFKLKYIFEYWFPVINFYENKKSNKPNRFGHLISPTWLFIGHNISKQYLNIDIIYRVLVPDAHHGRNSEICQQFRRQHRCTSWHWMTPKSRHWSIHRHTGQIWLLTLNYKMTIGNLHLNWDHLYRLIAL